jgi:hypothetical protein
VTVSRLRAQPRGPHSSFERAKLSRWTVLLLTLLRCYALAGIAIAVYAFLHAVR